MSNEYWTLDDVEALMRIMGEHGAISLELGELKITRQHKIELPNFNNAEEPSDDEILNDPYVGMRE